MRHWLGVAAALFALNAGPVLAQTAAPTPAKLSAPAATTAAASQGALIDINTASKDQLDTLPQIGAARAEAMAHRRPLVVDSAHTFGTRRLHRSPAHPAPARWPKSPSNPQRP